MGWESAMDDAKKGHRPKLKNWSRDGFATDRAADFEALASRLHKNEGSARCQVMVEQASSMTTEMFVTKYEATNTPVLIKGVVDEEEWPASRRWTLERLKEDFRDRKLKCGEDDDGYTIRVTVRNFTKYVEHQVDDSPLYIFDSTFDDDFSAKRLLDDYKVPKYFPSNPDQGERFGHTRESDELFDKPAPAAASCHSESGGGGGGGSSNQPNKNKNATPKSSPGVGYHDLFSLVGERRRPPYRWILVGPKRSGTCVHTDPLATSAWNTSVHGRKLWVLFPPGTPKGVVKARKFLRAGEDDEAINYFVDLLPRLAKAYPTLDMYQFIAGPGDTVFVPGGWWHAVLNLDDTVAVTQNFCSYQNFARVWKETRTGRKKMAVKWLRRLKEEHPSLAVEAERLNAQDGFVMPCDKKIVAQGVDAESSSRGESGSRGEGGADRGRKSAKEEKKRSKSKSKSRSKSKGGGGGGRCLASEKGLHEKNADGRKKHESVHDVATSARNAGGNDDDDDGTAAATISSGVVVASHVDDRSGGRGGSGSATESSGAESGNSRASGGVASFGGGSSGRSSGDDDDDDNSGGSDGDKGQKRKIETMAGALAEMTTTSKELGVFEVADNAPMAGALLASTLRN